MPLSRSNYENDFICNNCLSLNLNTITSEVIRWKDIYSVVLLSISCKNGVDIGFCPSLLIFTSTDFISKLVGYNI